MFLVLNLHQYISLPSWRRTDRTESLDPSPLSLSLSLSLAQSAGVAEYTDWIFAAG